jgi:hypothetical protein
MTIYLYHKRHLLTGLNYFGKTTTNPYTYLGSGKYWSSHLKMHGPDIETVQVWEFSDQDECTKFAIDFSVKNNIVESKQWANLKVENGKDGGNSPSAQTPEAKQKRKESLASYPNPAVYTNTPESIAKANASRAKTLAKKREQGLKHRGPDTKPRKAYELHKPFVNRNTPESLAKRKETLARKKLIRASSQ